MTDDPITLANGLKLDPAEITVDFIRASGPGGQNVNKVSSAVQLRFDAAGSPSLPDAVRRRAIVLAGRRATKDGVIVITAQNHRTQDRNRAEAIERLIDLLNQSTHVPKARIATKASRGSRERRLKAKKHRGAVKSARRVAEWDE
jgi:ribosome-associated protein